MIIYLNFAAMEQAFKNQQTGMMVNSQMNRFTNILVFNKRSMIFLQMDVCSPLNTQDFSTIEEGIREEEVFFVIVPPVIN